ncbi:hypothetical protein [Natronobacterium lacisalsi]|uniref:hypothetical protein n=1 Tax=Natronobacterium lacisalsi TaxID=229731 RepID=UPI0009D9457B|nr:hypothetical protein [Halobiforma lacisalsi]
MAIRKLQEVGGATGVTIPKDDLILEDLLNASGELNGEYHAHIKYEGGGEWRLKLLDIDGNADSTPQTE